MVLWLALPTSNLVNQTLKQSATNHFRNEKFATEASEVKIATLLCSSQRDIETMLVSVKTLAAWDREKPKIKQARKSKQRIYTLSSKEVKSS